MVLLHIYYKNDELIKKILDKTDSLNNDYFKQFHENPEKFVEMICNKVYQYSDEKYKIHCMLAHVYFLW